MSEETISHILIKVSQGERLSISGFITSTPGLAIHKQVRWSPESKCHFMTNKWQVTHIPSGHSLLPHTKALPRKKDAMKLAKRLNKVVDWVDTQFEDLVNNHEAFLAVSNAYDIIMSEFESEESGEIIVDEEYDGRFYVRKNRRTRKYEVVDQKTNSVALNSSDEQPLEFSHRGSAWKVAHVLNAEQ